MDKDLKEESPGIVNSSCRPPGWIGQVLKAAFFPCSLFSIFKFICFNRGLLYPPSWEVYLILPTWRKTISLKRSGPYVASSLSQVLSPWSPGSFLGGSTYSSGGGRNESFASRERGGWKDGDRCLFPLGRQSGNDYASARNRRRKWGGLRPFLPKAE